MRNIRRLNIFDKNQLKKIAGLSSLNSDYFKYNLLKELACSTQSLLPLRFKFMSESFVLVEDNRIKGMISICSTQGNPKQINITRLLFENNDYQTGKDLINFIISHYGAQGAMTFKVVVDNHHRDLEQLFMNGCGFRCCSYENLWDISHDIDYFNNIPPMEFQSCSEVPTSMLTELNNSEIINHYRPSLEHEEAEFKEPLIKLFENKAEANYVLIADGHAIAHLTIQTNDNYNFIISLTKNSGYTLDYNAITSFALRRIQLHRSSDFKVYLKQKKYLKFAQEYETYLHSRNYECVQTQHVLVKEFYKPLKQEFRAFIFSENKLFSN